MFSKLPSVLVTCGKLPTPITSFLLILVGLGIEGVSLIGSLAGEGPALSIDESETSRFKMSFSLVQFLSWFGEYG